MKTDTKPRNPTLPPNYTPSKSLKPELEEGSPYNTTLTQTAATMSNHPVVMYNQQGQMHPLTCIPFCAFGANLIGMKWPNMTFHVCNIFEPTVYEDLLE